MEAPPGGSLGGNQWDTVVQVGHIGTQWDTVGHSGPSGTQMMIVLVPLLALAALGQAQVGPLQDDPPFT